MEWNNGTLLYIHVAPKASAKMVELDEAELIFELNNFVTLFNPATLFNRTIQA